MSENPTAVRVRNLSVAVTEKGRDKTLLSGINFDIHQGQFVAVVGASGCGKSTLLKAIAGLLTPTSGTVRFCGRGVEDLRAELPLAIGYLPQFAAFHELLTVRENMRVASALRLPLSVPVERRKQWVTHIADLAGVGPILEQPYKTLSGGQMRRMALAEELIGDPAFLLLDELTSGLDAFSEREMMAWLRKLAGEMGKTVLLVTHSTENLDYCDAVLFLHRGSLVHFGDRQSLLDTHGAVTIADLFGIYATRQEALSPARQDDAAAEDPTGPGAVKSLPPPNGWIQFPTLLARQARLFWRDKGQIVLHIALAVTFPALVAVFATGGLPQVRNQTLELQTNVLRTLQEQLLYLRESFQSASLISGLAMFQVILLTLIGANNGAREIAKERSILDKELRAGLSPAAYVAVKFIQLALLCALQALWMAWFVKTVCGFPGNLWDQFLILFATALAMSATCLAISAAAPSPERASLLAIYLVGFQLPLSGAALALPDWLSLACRPFIAAYWGWSGYLQTFHDTRYFDIVEQSSKTWIAPFGLAVTCLALHTVVAASVAVVLARRER